MILSSKLLRLQQSKPFRGHWTNIVILLGLLLVLISPCNSRMIRVRRGRYRHTNAMSQSNVSSPPVMNAAKQSILAMLTFGNSLPRDSPSTSTSTSTSTPAATAAPVEYRVNFTEIKRPFTFTLAQATDYEKEALKYGILDVNSVKRSSYLQRKELLCATFVFGSLNPSIILHANMATMGSSCDWAIVMYGTDDSYFDKVCDNHEGTVSIVMCRLSEHFNPSADPLSMKSIPKSVMYHELLPILPNYRRVFLMDEDMSLVGFKMSSITLLWDCSFNPPPLIVQPLIFENTQYFPFVNYHSWMKRPYVASAVGIVEQQVPIFNSIFFEWFIRRVLSKTKEKALELGVDWGHDRSWCNAAYAFGKYVLGWSNYTTPCAVMIEASPVHHMNTHSIKSKRLDPTSFRRNGSLIVEEYQKYFSSWVQEDIIMSTNPMHPYFSQFYEKLLDVRQECYA